MGKRVVIIYSLMVLGFSLLSLRIAMIISSDKLSQASTAQSSFVLDVGESRGTIYDRYFAPLTNNKVYNVAAVLPGVEAKNALLAKISSKDKDTAMKMLDGGAPFVCPVESPYIYSKGIDVFKLYKRTSDDQLAVHIVGQLDPETGKGSSGLEYALDEYLRSKGGRISIRYPTNGLRQSLSAGEIVDTGYHDGGGVVTTLDSDIQALAEKAARAIPKGSVVVQDCITGDLLAAVSTPSFNPNDLGASLSDPNAPFVNRSFSAYSVGSTFKLLVAATALEQGFTIDRTFDCKGYIMIGDQRINCHKLVGHGVLNMTQALEKSCNPYFISIAMQLGGKDLAYKASQLGFGAPTEFLPGYKTKSGNLPSYDQLKLPAATANLGFGQGDLLATPIQMASLVSSIANGGKFVNPRLIVGFTDNGSSISTHTAVYTPQIVFHKAAADKVKQMMISVVENGSGKPAKPEIGGAGGKTASAQSGQFVDGNEVIQAWFGGFYPADTPRYTIMVLVEGGDSGTDTACPVFKEICDGIYEIESRRKGLQQ